jgi:hypothetical protein
MQKIRFVIYVILEDNIPLQWSAFIYLITPLYAGLKINITLKKLGTRIK